MADQEPRVAGMTLEEIRKRMDGVANHEPPYCDVAEAGHALCDEVERLRSGGVVALDTHQRVVGERDAEIERLKKELTNLGYRYEDALAELARERDRD